MPEILKNSPTKVEFELYLENILQNFYDNEIQKIEKKDFLQILKDESIDLLKNIDDLEKSNAPDNFKGFIRWNFNYGIQSAFWYLKLLEQNANSANSSLVCASPEVYEKTSNNYVIGRKWLHKLKEDCMI